MSGVLPTQDPQATPTAPLFSERIAEEPGALERRLGRVHRELRHAAHPAKLLAGPVRGGLEGRHGRRELRAHVGETDPTRPCGA